MNQTKVNTFKNIDLFIENGNNNWKWTSRQKKPYGSIYLDNQSGTEYIQVDSPQGSNWQLTVTPAELDQRIPTVENLKKL